MPFLRGTRLPLLSRGVAVAAADNWWETGGAFDCVGAYKGVGAGSYAASKVNLTNPGTYNLTSTLDPSWDATGWNFAGASSLLQTGIVPNTVKPYTANYLPWTVVARFSDLNTASTRHTLVAAGSSGVVPTMFIWPFYTGTQVRTGNHGNITFTPSMGVQTEGVYAYSGQRLLFYNTAQGHVDLGTRGANSSGSITYGWRIGLSSINNFPANLKVQAVSIYTIELSVAITQGIMEAVHALS